MKSIRRLLKLRDPHDLRLVLEADGVELRDAIVGDALWRVTWDTLVEITAFKADAKDNILLCIGLLPENAAKAHVVDEMTPGWDALVRELSTRFAPELATKFRAAVDSPIGKGNTVLWSRR